MIATRTVSTGLATNNTEYIGKGQDSTCGIVTIGDQLTDVTVGDTRTLTGVNVLADGDANGDGSITISDALSIVSFILGTMPSDFTYYAADVNHDCKVTIADAVDVVNMILSGN